MSVRTLTVQLPLKLVPSLADAPIMLAGGERVFERDAQNPTEAEAVMGAGAAGHPVFLPREICVGPRER